MEWKTVKARKDYTCEGCDKPILKGELYDFVSGRQPVCDKDDKQTGIEYFKIRTHRAELNCHWPEECKKGNHSEKFHVESNPESIHYGDTFVYCENCCSDLSNIEA